MTHCYKSRSEFPKTSMVQNFFIHYSVPNITVPQFQQYCRCTPFPATIQSKGIFTRWQIPRHPIDQILRCPPGGSSSRLSIRTRHSLRNRKEKAEARVRTSLGVYGGGRRKRLEVEVWSQPPSSFLSNDTLYLIPLAPGLSFLTPLTRVSFHLLRDSGRTALHSVPT